MAAIYKRWQTKRGASLHSVGLFYTAAIQPKWVTCSHSEVHHAVALLEGGYN